MIEAVCFEKEHRYLPSDNGGYTCQSCKNNISDVEFAMRISSHGWVEGKTPLIFCEICKTFHTPYSFDVNSRINISYHGRKIDIFAMGMGEFSYKTDQDESGYFSAVGWQSAVMQIKEDFRLKDRRHGSNHYDNEFPTYCDAQGREHGEF